jgi:MFS superfamily sulfate permease-like transporter
MKRSFWADLKYDLPAGVVVFLVALPLCLGVALASGAPLISGVIAGIIGGLVVGSISGSSTSVSGPAAGLAAVVLVSIAQLGSFETFLVAVFIAGAIQLVAGLLRAGFIADYIPSNVIKGLLAAIGIILILKQIPHAVGFDKDAMDDFAFFQADGENTFSELLKIFTLFTPGAVIISAFSLIVLTGWDKTPMRHIKFFPASLLVVVAGIAINYLLGFVAPDLMLKQEHLVNMPDMSSASLTSLIKVPNATHLLNPLVWKVGVTVAIIASLETLLNIEAVDNLDPHKRQSPPNRELVAQGVGNMLSGLFGGIPVTSVIVRSSVNINANAQTRTSTILHGTLLLLSVLLLAPVLNMVPLSCLAAILLVTGYKLAKVSLFKHMYRAGWNQFIPFIGTIAAIIFTDLLIGILIGLAVSIFFLLRSNFLNPFQEQREQLHIGEMLRIELSNQVSFLNKASIKNTLWQIPENSRVVIDASKSDFIDPDVVEVIEDFKETVAPEKEIQLNIIDMKKGYKLRDQLQFVNVLDKETRNQMQPVEILDLLKKGNERFVKGNFTEKYFRQQINATAAGQAPMAVVLSCIDSRTSAELIFDCGMGDIFSIRVAGNVVNDDILGSMEFACQVAGAKVVVVLGHTKCGAIEGACNHVQMGNLTQLLQKIKPAVDLAKRASDNLTIDKNFVDEVAKVNVGLTIDTILEKSEIINRLAQSGQILITGAMYHIETGAVEFYRSPALLEERNLVVV